MGLGDFGQIGGALIGGAASLIGGEQANAANARQAQAQMDFQERMSDTAHQREVKDLKAAGLNPILSVNAGSSTPSGAMATMQNTMAQAVTGASQGAKTVQDSIALGSALGLQDAQRLGAIAQSTKDNATAKATNIQAEKNRAELELIKSSMGAQKAKFENDQTAEGYRKASMLYDFINDKAQKGITTLNSAKDIFNVLHPKKETPNSQEIKINDQADKIWQQGLK